MRSRSVLGWSAGLVLASVSATAPQARAQSFTFLQPPFTQEIWGVDPGFLGGVAFAANGDVIADVCSFSGSPIIRWDTASTIVVNTTTIHVNLGPTPSNAGCGLTNNTDGFLYTNTSLGCVRLDATTFAQVGAPFGPGGNALGIAPDPQTGDLVYVGSDGTLHRVDAAFTTASIFSTVMTGNFVDGIYWDPMGDFLFCANRSPLFLVTIVDRLGNLVQHVPFTSEPDGIAFHATDQFVVTNNTDGTMTRLDFPGNDFTLPPVLSVFASGGFRGDLSQVGDDGCLYLTQNGTRYDNGTTTFENSIVRICGGFEPPVNVPPECNVDPGPHVVMAGSPVSVLITGTDANTLDLLTMTSGALPSGATLTPPSGSTGFSPFNVVFDWTPSNAQLGTHVITVTFTDPSGESSTCTFTVEVTSECHLVLGTGPGSSQHTIDGHTYSLELASVLESHPTLMETLPGIRLFPPPHAGQAAPSSTIRRAHGWTNAVREVYAQVVMWNPPVFPANPEQHSVVLHAVVRSDGSILTEVSGTQDGIHIQAETFVDAEGWIAVRFPFTIDGL
jgi:hypothetical protein